MNRCPSQERLEEAVLGEVKGDLASAEIESHAQVCARCRHELHWIQSEAMLFARRSARDNVQRLVVQSKRSGAGKSFLRLPMSRAVAAIAASLMLAVGVGLWAKGTARSMKHDSIVQPMSFETMSVELEALSRSERCYTPGFGIACGEIQLASR